MELSLTDFINISVSVFNMTVHMQTVYSTKGMRRERKESEQECVNVRLLRAWDSVTLEIF